MILLIQDDSIHVLSDISTDNIFGTRILSSIMAYGIDKPFALFWNQVDEQKKTASFISSIDNNFTLICSENTDYSELYCFLSAMNPNNIFCDSKSAEILGLNVVNSPNIMKLNKLNSIETESDYNTCTNPKLDELYDLLSASQSSSIKIPDKNSWYVDFSHRSRHNTARSIVLYNNGIPVACALTSSETENSAIISGVVVLPQYRGMRYGSYITGKLCKMLTNENKTVYLCCEDKLIDFYKNIGFSAISKDAICSLNADTRNEDFNE